MKKFILFTFCMVTIFISCKKDNDVKNNGLVGKWKLVGTLDTYNGGSSWAITSEEVSHTLDFANNGDLVKREAAGGVNAICTGTYTSLPDYFIRVNAPCYLPNEMIRVSAISSTQLILDRQGIESVIKFKYKAVK